MKRKNIKYNKSGKGKRSNAEIAYEQTLLNYQKAQIIFDLQIQVKFPVYIAEILVMTYEADFTFRKTSDPNRLVVVDYKGSAFMVTNEWKLKRRCVEAYYDTIVYIVPNKSEPLALRRKKNPLILDGVGVI